MIALIRVPYLSRYNELDVREEPIISSAAGLLNHHGLEFEVFDFHLDRDLTVAKLLKSKAKKFILGVRGTGLHWKYAHQITRHILNETSADVLIYGQTGKLSSWRNPAPNRVTVLPHDEDQLASYFEIKKNEITFETGLRHYPYGLKLLPKLGRRRALFKATIETTRGCHYGCKFCFINHGVNYPVRYARRPVEDILADMLTYLNAGISNFWFYDSEFIGADKKQYPIIIDILNKLKSLKEKYDFEIMIYSRSDTLRKLGEFELLRKAGIRTILMGIESLDSSDLKAMRKAQDVAIAEETIRSLREHGIFCNLSFILFNKSATINSIIENIERMINLFKEDDFVYLGQLQYFSYAFESDWSPNEIGDRTLSGKTQLQNSTGSTDSGNNFITFDPALEPLAEIYRIINYEQIRKTCELVILAQESDAEGMKEMHEWATNLSLFILNLMYIAAVSYRTGTLTLESVKDHEKWVYREYKKFNELLLDTKKQNTITDISGYWTGDWNGWEDWIPTI